MVVEADLAAAHAGVTVAVLLAMAVAMMAATGGQAWTFVIIYRERLAGMLGM